MTNRAEITLNKKLTDLELEYEKQIRAMRLKLDKKRAALIKKAGF